MNNYFKIFVTVCSVFSIAQAQEKPPLTIEAFDSWKSIGYNAISKSGKYVYYTVNAQEGDAYTELKDQNNNLLLHVARGVSPKLSKDERFLVNTVKPFYKETRDAKIKKKKPNEMPQDSLVFFDIQTKQSTKLGPIKSWKAAREIDSYIAFSQELEVKGKADTTKADTSITKAPAKKTSAKKELVVILYNLRTKDTLQFWKAENFYFDDNEKYFVYNIKGAEKDSTKTPGLYVYNLQDKKVKKIYDGKATFQNITFSDASDKLAFVVDTSSAKALLKMPSIYQYDFKAESAKELISKNTAGIPNNWYIPTSTNLSFSASGNRLFFGIAPIPKVKDTTLVEFEHAKVDIWHWQDELLMTQQLASLPLLKNKTYRAVYHFAENKLVPLANLEFENVSLTENADEEWGLTSYTSLENKIARQWSDGTRSDIYVVSLNNGNRQLVRRDFLGNTALSPKATHVLLFDKENQNWYAYNISTKTTACLTCNLNVTFGNEDNDSPALPQSYGIAGWSNDHKGVYLYDKYDLWYVDFDGKTPKNITQSVGRNNKIRFRLISFSSNKPRSMTTYLDPKKVVLLSSFNENDKQNGIFKLEIAKNKAPKEIIQSQHVYKRISADENQTIFTYSRENYQESTNLFVSKDFVKATQLTDINPQQKQYNWGTAELVRWKTPKGYDAEGILYKPENFDPNKKYPIIAYFYEVLSDGLYNYHEPAPTPSRLMIPYFVSNGYLVFAPDIRYEIGHPGKSAEEYINSGMRYLAKNSWVDSTKMGIQGQSWGGYQVTHLITSTNMYAAAWAGAPVVNMTSAYGGIRWQTGMSRQFQYEKTQSRLGATLWEKPELYLENSPLFNMDKVTTPVAIMHNDNDGAVPWYQGIEMFTALRRLQKPVWLLNYNGDGHNLMERQNRKDIQRRQAQFFDHFLKGKPAADWIKKGVPAVNKGIDWGFNITD